MAYIVNIPRLRLGEDEVFTAGERIELPSNLAAKLLKKAYIRFDHEPKKVISTPAVQTENIQMEKIIPDGNVEKVLEYISGISDVELLKRIAVEEESGKNRKTVLAAVENKIQEITEEDDLENDVDPQISFNPEEVIANG